jgi:hypothetical protein
MVSDEVGLISGENAAERNNTLTVPGFMEGERMRRTSIMLLIVSLCIALGLLATAATAEAEELDTVLFLHWVNDEEPSRDLGGHSVRNFLDTTTDFEDVNRSVTSGAKWEEDWYLHPLLAEDLTTDNVTLGLWMNASGGQKRAQITVTLLDIADAASDPAGTPVHEENYGNTPLFATPHFMTFPLSFPAYTFQAGHTLRVLISMTPGTSTFVTIIWDTQTADSRLSIRTSDRIAIERLGLRNPDGEPTLWLDPLAIDMDVILFTEIGDPLGIYDVYQVRATLIGPGDEIIFDNVTMDRPAIPRGMSPGEFTLLWDYNGSSAGLYTLTAWAVDLSGISYRDHFAHGDLDGYPVLLAFQFTIGSVREVNLLCVDGGGRPLANATVTAGPGGPGAITDEEGRATLQAYDGEITFVAMWMGVEVGSNTTSVTGPGTSSDPIWIECAVFLISFRTIDGHGDPIPDTAVQVVLPTGDTDVHPLRTGVDGIVEVGLAAGAPHNVVVHWRGFLVADTQVTPEADGVIDVPCNVHWASLHIADADGEPLPSVQVVVMDLATGAVVGFGTTDAEGDVEMLLPGIAIEIEVYWRGELVRERDDLSLETGDLTSSMSCQVFRATVEVLDKDGNGLRGVPVVVEDEAGEEVTTSITDNKGQVVFQVGEGMYNATAFLTVTYRWTEVIESEATSLEVNESGTWTLEFEDYPPGVLGTVQFWSVAGIVILFGLLLFVAWTYLRSIRRPPKAPTIDGGEDEEGEGSEDEEDEEGSTSGIETETYHRSGPT